MKEPHRSASREVKGVHLGDGVMVSDGMIDLALMPCRLNEENFEQKILSASGIGHIGFWFDEAEAEEIETKLRRAGAIEIGNARVVRCSRETGQGPTVFSSN
jgi:hypothetical protein